MIKVGDIKTNTIYRATPFKKLIVVITMYTIIQIMVSIFFISIILFVQILQRY